MYSADFLTTIFSNLVSGMLLPSTLVRPFITLTAMGSLDLVCYNVTDNNLRFQWSKDNANIALATSRVYTVNASDSGSSRGIYCCSISDTLNNIIDQRCVVVYIPCKYRNMFVCYHTMFLVSSI